MRDALIQAVVDRKLGTYPMDPEKSQQTTMTKVTFDRDGKPFRAIGLLNKPDSNLMCAQCHVEYNCGPGFDCAEKGKEFYIKMDDPRTNLFPWTNVFGYKKVMTEDYKFKDFKHAATGALLPKIQHPEMETYWGSKHEKAGVQCKDCHMGKAKNAKGKTYTNHQQKSPKFMLKETCLTCHTDWTEHDAKYNMEAIQNYTRGKMAEAEFWLANADRHDRQGQGCGRVQRMCSRRPTTTSTTPICTGNGGPPRTPTASTIRRMRASR